MLSIEENEEEEEEEDDEEENEDDKKMERTKEEEKRSEKQSINKKEEEKKSDKQPIKKEENKKIENQMIKKEEKKDYDKDDINNGSFMTQPPFKKNQNQIKKLNINNIKATINKNNSDKNIISNNNKKNVNLIKNNNINSNENKKNNYNNINNNITSNPNQDKKSSITVAIRVRPLNQNELEITPVEGIKIINSNSLIVTSDPNAANKKTNLIKEHQFFFDYVFGPSASQEQVYESTTQKLLPGIIDGFNATVFAYGATGSGKTYTMLGTIKKEGIMTRSISELFKLLNNKRNKEFKLEVSYIEIYNEIIRDLLSEGNVIDIHEDPNIGIILQGVKEIEVESNESFYDVLSVGNRKRTTGSTNNNETSSRSHAVLRVNLYNQDRNSKNLISGRFIMVDLAGSEKTSINSNNTNAQRQNEGKNINKSLLALGVCINSLAKKNQFIPWRNSKLTRILKDCLGGNSRIVMISTISPSIYNIDETINTLLYSNRAKNIQTIIKRNVISTIEHDSQVNKYDEIISNLSSELQGLRQELAVKIHNKHLLPKKELSSPNIMFSGANKMEKLSKEINNHFNEEKRYKSEIIELKTNINNLMANLKEKEFSLYKIMNRKEINKSSSVRDVMRQNYLRKVPLYPNFREKAIQEQIKTLNSQLSYQKDLLSIKENQYKEIYAKREDLEASISKLGSAMKNIASNDNGEGLNALEYLYQSYILEIDNMENDFLRKQSLGEIRTKDIKIQKLVEQLKIRDQYIDEEKKQLAKKKIKYFFKGENEIKKLEELNIDKNFSLPFIIQQENNSFNQNDNKFRSLDNSKLKSRPMNSNRINLISNGRYDYSGYCNPNIIKEKKVIKTKTNEIMRKTKRSELSDLKLNILNEQYKNSKVFYINKGTNPNFSFSDEPNVIAFDSRKLNKSQSNSSFSHGSQNDSMDNSYRSSKVYNYKERKIDKTIKNIMFAKKKMSPYLK